MPGDAPHQVAVSPIIQPHIVDFTTQMHSQQSYTEGRAMHIVSGIWYMKACSVGSFHLLEKAK